MRSSRGADFRVSLPTLAEYVTMTPRIVTPVSLNSFSAMHMGLISLTSRFYPADANLIASLLDIHASPSPSTQGPPSLELLEAGTGHRGLTLHLARAIHAANALRPKNDSPSGEARENLQSSSFLKNGASDFQRPSGLEDHLNTRSESSYERSTDDRQAVVHTLDVSWKHSSHAEQIVKGFRQGLYTNNIVFHVGDVSQYVNCLNKNLLFQTTI